MTTETSVTAKQKGEPTQSKTESNKSADMSMEKMMKTEEVRAVGRGAGLKVC